MGNFLLIVSNNTDETALRAREWGMRRHALGGRVADGAAGPMLGVGLHTGARLMVENARTDEARIKAILE